MHDDTDAEPLIVTVVDKSNRIGHEYLIVYRRMFFLFKYACHT